MIKPVQSPVAMVLLSLPPWFAYIYVHECVGICETATFILFLILYYIAHFKFYSTEQVLQQPARIITIINTHTCTLSSIRCHLLLGIFWCIKCYINSPLCSNWNIKREHISLSISFANNTPP